MMIKLLFMKHLQIRQCPILKGLLESYGIECFLTDELMAALNVAYCAAIGGV